MIDEVSNTCIESFQLVDILDFQVIQVATSFTESDPLATQCIKHGTDIHITENMLRFPMAEGAIAPPFPQDDAHFSTDDKQRKGRGLVGGYPSNGEE